MPTSSPVFPRTFRPTPSSSAGGRTGRTRSHTCYPPSTLPHGFRPTSICLSRTLRSTAKTPTLNPTAGACVTCPRRSGHNTSLFCDVQGDQCLDSSCYHSKVEVFLDREIAAHPGLIQIESGWRKSQGTTTGSRPARPRSRDRSRGPTTRTRNQ